jgi:GDP-L-fucose synthase
LDLLDAKESIKAAEGIEIMLGLAAKVGGIEYNRTHNATMFRDNMRLSMNMLESARINRVERFLTISSACVYPAEAKVPTPESEGFVGMPEATNRGYGLSKRMAEYLSRAYAEEFGLKVAIARPFNAYGPRDDFTPERSHVIASLIRRIFNHENPLVVWGSGEQSRAFIYVSDFVAGLLAVAEKYPVCEPVNIGTDEEVKIKDLAQLIVRLSGRSPKLVFDAARSSGQMRRNSDTTKAREVLQFKTKVSLEEGLKKTIEWYRVQKGI